jgi:hypothetical protein
LKLECEDCGRSVRLPVDDDYEPPVHRCLRGEVRPFPGVTEQGRANSYWFNHLLD